eukprot:4483281-Amphidinium_carterae.2
MEQALCSPQTAGSSYSPGLPMSFRRTEFKARRLSQSQSKVEFCCICSPIQGMCSGLMGSVLSGGQGRGTSRSDSCAAHRKRRGCPRLEHAAVQRAVQGCGRHVALLLLVACSDDEHKCFSSLGPERSLGRRSQVNALMAEARAGLARVEPEMKAAMRALEKIDKKEPLDAPNM